LLLHIYRSLDYIILYLLTHSLRPGGWCAQRVTVNSKQNTSSSVTSNICKQYQYDRKRRRSCASDSNLKSFNPLLHRHIFRCQKKIQLITLIHFNQMKFVSSSELQNKDWFMIYFCVTLWIQHAIAMNVNAVNGVHAATRCCYQWLMMNDVNASAQSARCYQLDTPGVSKRKLGA